MDMTKYVVGLLFTDDLKSVVLVRKNRPTWQAGRHNGVGGKVLPGESYDVAMNREFAEEAGVWIATWTRVLTLHLPGAEVAIFASVSTHNVARTYTRTDEQIVVRPVDNLDPCVDGLTEIVSLSLDNLRCHLQGVKRG